MIVCGLIFMYFNDASLQEWNKPAARKYDEVKQKEDLIFTEEMLRQKEDEFERKM